MRWLTAIISILLISKCAAQPATAPAERVGKFPHVEVDVGRGQVRVECQALRVEAALEFFCVSAGTSEHESVLRSQAKPSHIHAGLLMLGLEPGEPVRYSVAAKKWLPPHGPPLDISVEFQQDGKTVTIPATKLMRSIKTKEPMPPMHWIFAGSRVMDDGNYAADVTGYIVSIVNFDLALIDVPELASNSNETLQWETNLDVMPKAGATVTMIIEPLRDAPTTQGALGVAAELARGESAALSDIQIDALRKRWETRVLPHDAALREAAQAHYEALAELRKEQQRLIDEADRIQRLIDDLEKQYQQMTTPRPR